MDEKQGHDLHIDDVESNGGNKLEVVGTVKLIDSAGINLVPTPTRDPNGKLDHSQIHTANSVLMKDQIPSTCQHGRNTLS